MVWTERTRRILPTPWDGLWRLGADADRLLRGARGEPRMAGAPPVNLYANEDGLRVRLLLPGYRSDEVEVRLDDETTLLVRGGAGAQGRRPLTRRLRLPFRVDADRVRARLEAGELEIELPRRAQDRPRTVPIEPA